MGVLYVAWRVGVRGALLSIGSSRVLAPCPPCNAALLRLVGFAGILESQHRPQLRWMWPRARAPTAGILRFLLRGVQRGGGRDVFTGINDYADMLVT